MNFEVLKTGSKGNCTIVGNTIMLDCGVPYKTIEPYLKNIKLIFISHSHKDHLLPSTVRKVAYDHPKIAFVIGKPLLPILRELGVKRIIPLDTGKWFDIGLCRVRLDWLYHDVPNFAIHLDYKGKKLFYCTDTSRIDHIEAKEYDQYLIEANYDSDEELDRKIVEAHERGEFTYLERVRHTHLSQLQALNWLDNNMGSNSHYTFMHQHIPKEDEYGNDHF